MAAQGRTRRVWVRDADNHRLRAMMKYPPPAFPQEIYSLGMERVAYRLGVQLGLPIPAVWLEEWEGQPCAVMRRVMNSRTWQMAGAAPALMLNVENRDTWPLSVVFDLWLANNDRVPRNILVEPLPEGRPAGRASSSRTWLIDHGVTGLWFPSKFDIRLTVGQTEQVVVGNGDMLDAVERDARRVMPADYRAAFTSLTNGERDQVIDVVARVPDDEIANAVREVPTEYFSSTQASLTIELLKARRDRVDYLAGAHW